MTYLDIPACPVFPLTHACSQPILKEHWSPFFLEVGQWHTMPIHTMRGWLLHCSQSLIPVTGMPTKSGHCYSAWVHMKQSLHKEALLTLPTQDSFPSAGCAWMWTSFQPIQVLLPRAGSPPAYPHPAWLPYPAQAQHSSFPSPCTDDRVGLDLIDYDLVVQ